MDVKDMASSEMQNKRKQAEDDGFKSTVIWKLDEACSRDKALYYFYKNKNVARKNEPVDCVHL